MVDVNRPTDLEVSLLRQLTEIEQNLEVLSAERDVIKRLILKARKDDLNLRDVRRKNSIDRIVIESGILEVLRGAKRGIRTKQIFATIRISAPQLKSATFRSHLHRLKERGLIVSVRGHGYWALPPEKLLPNSPQSAADALTIDGSR